MFNFQADTGTLELEPSHCSGTDNHTGSFTASVGIQPSPTTVRDARDNEEARGCTLELGN